MRVLCAGSLNTWKKSEHCNPVTSPCLCDHKPRDLGENLSAPGSLVSHGDQNSRDHIQRIYIRSSKNNHIGSSDFAVTF